MAIDFLKFEELQALFRRKDKLGSLSDEEETRYQELQTWYQQTFNNPQTPEESSASTSTKPKVETPDLFAEKQQRREEFKERFKAPGTPSTETPKGTPKPTIAPQPATPAPQPTTTFTRPTPQPVTSPGPTNSGKNEPKPADIGAYDLSLFKQLGDNLGDNFDVLPSQEFKNGVRRVAIRRKSDGEILAADIGVVRNKNADQPVFKVGELTGTKAPAVISPYLIGRFNRKTQDTHWQGVTSLQDLTTRVTESFMAKDEGVVDTVQEGFSHSLSGTLFKSSPPVARLPHNAPEAVHNEMLSRIGIIKEVYPDPTANEPDREPLAPFESQRIDQDYVENVLHNTGAIGGGAKEDFVWTQLRRHAYFPSKRGGLEPYADVTYTKYIGQPGDQGVLSSEAELLTGLKGMSKRSIEYGGIEVKPHVKAIGPAGGEILVPQKALPIRNDTVPGFARLTGTYPGEQNVREAEVRMLRLTPTPFAGAAILHNTANPEAEGYSTQSQYRAQLPGVNLLDLMTGKAKIDIPTVEGQNYGEGEQSISIGTFTKNEQEYPLEIQKGVAPFNPNRVVGQIPGWWDPKTGKAAASEEFGQSTAPLLPKLKELYGIDFERGTAEDINVLVSGRARRPGRTRGAGQKAGIVISGETSFAQLPGSKVRREVHETTGEVKGPSMGWAALASRSWPELQSIMSDWANVTGTKEAAQLNRYFQRFAPKGTQDAPEVDWDKVANRYRRLTAGLPQDERFRGGTIGMTRNIFQTVFGLKSEENPLGIDLSTPEGQARNLRNWEKHAGAYFPSEEVSAGPTDPEQYEMLKGFATQAIKMLPGQEKTTDKQAGELFEAYFKHGEKNDASSVVLSALRGAKGGGTLPELKFKTADSTFVGRFATPMVADDIASARVNLETQLSLSAQYPEFGRALGLAIEQESDGSDLSRALSDMVSFSSFTKQAQAGTPMLPEGAETLSQEQMLQMKDLYNRQDVSNQEWLSEMEKIVGDPSAMLNFPRTQATMPSIDATKELSYSKYGEDIGPIVGQTRRSINNLLKEELSIAHKPNYDPVAAGVLAVNPLFRHVENLLQGEGEVAKNLFSKETPVGWAGRYQLDLSLPIGSMTLDERQQRMVLSQAGLRGNNIDRNLPLFDEDLYGLLKREPLMSVESLVPFKFTGDQELRERRGEENYRRMERLRNVRGYGYAWTDLSLSQVAFGDLDADIVNAIIGAEETRGARPVYNKEGEQIPHRKKDIVPLSLDKIREIQAATLNPQRAAELEAAAIPNEAERQKANAFIGSFQDYFKNVNLQNKTVQQEDVLAKGMNKYGFYPMEQVAKRGSQLAFSSTIGMGKSFNTWRQNIIGAALGHQNLVAASRGGQGLYQPYLDLWNLETEQRLPAITSKFYAGMKEVKDKDGKVVDERAFVGYSTDVKNDQGIPEYNRLYKDQIGEGGVLDFVSTMASHASAPIQEAGQDPQYIVSAGQLAYQFAQEGDEDSLRESLEGMKPEQYSYGIQKYLRGMQTEEEKQSAAGVRQYEERLMDLPIMRHLMSRATSKQHRTTKLAEQSKESLRQFGQAVPELKPKWDTGSAIHDVLYRFPTGGIAAGRLGLDNIENPSMIGLMERVMTQLHVPIPINQLINANERRGLIKADRPLEFTWEGNRSPDEMYGPQSTIQGPNLPSEWTQDFRRVRKTPGGYEPVQAAMSPERINELIGTLFPGAQQVFPSSPVQSRPTVSSVPAPAPTPTAATSAPVNQAISNLETVAQTPMPQAAPEQELSFEEEMARAANQARAQENNVPLTLEEKREYMRLDNGGIVTGEDSTRYAELKSRYLAETDKFNQEAESKREEARTSGRYPDGTPFVEGESYAETWRKHQSSWQADVDGGGSSGSGSSGGGGGGGGGSGGGGDDGGNWSGPSNRPPSRRGSNRAVEVGYKLTRQWAGRAPGIMENVRKALGIDDQNPNPPFMELGRLMAEDPSGTMQRLGPRLSFQLRRLTKVSDARAKALAVLPKSSYAGDEQIKSTLMAGGEGGTGGMFNLLGNLGASMETSETGINPIMLQQLENLPKTEGFQRLSSEINFLGLTGNVDLRPGEFRQRAGMAIGGNAQNIQLINQAMALKSKFSGAKADYLPQEVQQLAAFGESVKIEDKGLLKETGPKATGRIELPGDQVDKLNALYAEQKRILTDLAQAQQTNNKNEEKKLTVEKARNELDIRKEEGKGFVSGLKQEITTLREQYTAGDLDAKGLTRLRKAGKELQTLEAEQLQQAQEEKSPWGGIARRMLGGFGLMYMRSIGNLMTSGMGYGQQERLGLEMSTAGQAGQIFGTRDLAANQGIQLQNQLALSGSSYSAGTGMQLLGAKNPWLREAGSATIAGVGAWGMMSYMSSMEGLGALGKFALPVGMAVGAGNIGLQAYERMQSPDSLASRTASGRFSLADTAAAAFMRTRGEDGWQKFEQDTNFYADANRYAQRGGVSFNQMEQLYGQYGYKPSQIYGALTQSYMMAPGGDRYTQEAHQQAVGIFGRSTGLIQSVQSEQQMAADFQLGIGSDRLAAKLLGGLGQTPYKQLAQGEEKVSLVDLLTEGLTDANIGQAEKGIIEGGAAFFSQIPGIQRNKDVQAVIGSTKTELETINARQEEVDQRIRQQQDFIDSGSGASPLDSAYAIDQKKEEARKELEELRAERDAIRFEGKEVRLFAERGAALEGTKEGELYASRYAAESEARRGGLSYTAPSLESYFQPGTAELVPMTTEQLNFANRQATAITATSQYNQQIAQAQVNRSYQFGERFTGDRIGNIMAEAPQDQKWAYNRAFNMDPMMLGYLGTQGVDLGAMPGLRSFTGSNINPAYFPQQDVGLNGQITGLGYGRTSFTQIGGQSAEQMLTNMFGDWKNNAKFSQAGLQAGLEGQPLMAPITLPNGEVISSVGGTMGMQMYQDQLQYNQQMEQLGRQDRGRELQFAFTTGIGLNAYNGTVDPRTGQPFGNLGQTGGFWGLEDRSRAQGYAQQEWQFGFQERGIEQQSAQFFENLAMTMQQSMRQRTWTQQDWSFQDEGRAMTWGWKQEDFQENARFMTGRDRRLAERSMERESIMHDREGEGIDRQRARQKELWAMEDDRFEVQKKHHLESVEMQREQLEKSQEFFRERKEIEEEQVKLTRAYFVLQNALQKESIESEKKYAEENLKLRNTFNQLQIATELTKGQLQTITDDGFEQMRLKLVELFPTLAAIFDLMIDAPPIQGPLVNATGGYNPIPTTSNFTPPQVVAANLALQSSTPTGQISGPIVQYTHAEGGFPGAGVHTVGERGFEFVIDGEVIPHNQSKQLAAMGLQAGQTTGEAASRIDSYFQNAASDYAATQSASVTPNALRSDTITYGSSTSQRQTKTLQPIVINIGNQELARYVVEIIGDRL